MRAFRMHARREPVAAAMGTAGDRKRGKQVIAKRGVKQRRRAGQPAAPAPAPASPDRAADLFDFIGGKGEEAPIFRKPDAADDESDGSEELAQGSDAAADGQVATPSPRSEADEADAESIDKRSEPSDSEDEDLAIGGVAADDSLSRALKAAASAEDLGVVKERIRKTVETLVAWKTKKHALQQPRAAFVDRLVRDVVAFYGYNEPLAEYFVKLLGPVDAVGFFEACEKPRPMCLRTNMLVTRRRDLAKTLISRGANVDPLAEWSKIGLQVIDSSVPVGATPEYCAGHYMIQSASSFIPVMALNPQPGELVLDMCAAPGGKSTHIGQLMRNSGTLFCNELKKDRCAALAANLHRMGITNSVISNLDGLELPLHLPKLDRVLLDAPCTGTGIISRDPSVKTKREPKDFKQAATLQKLLLKTAVDMVSAAAGGGGADDSTGGGVIVYSTCSLSIEENEEVIDFILNSRSVKVVPIDVPVGEPGFTKFQDKRFHPSLSHARRIYPHQQNLDGFFVCKLRKFSDKIPALPPRSRTRKGQAPKEQHWGKEHWKPELLEGTPDVEAGAGAGAGAAGEDQVSVEEEDEEEVSC